jgi:hypothetical protein
MSPLTTAQTLTSMTAEGTRNVTGGQVITLNLRFNGVAFDPAALLAALKTLYGATKVYATTDTTAQGTYSLEVIA